MIITQGSFLQTALTQPPGPSERQPSIQLGLLLMLSVILHTRGRYNLCWGKICTVVPTCSGLLCSSAVIVSVCYWVYIWEPGMGRGDNLHGSPKHAKWQKHGKFGTQDGWLSAFFLYFFLLFILESVLPARCARSMIMIMIMRGEQASSDKCLTRILHEG